MWFDSGAMHIARGIRNLEFIQGERQKRLFLCSSLSTSSILSKQQVLRVVHCDLGSVFKHLTTERKAIVQERPLTTILAT